MTGTWSVDPLSSISFAARTNWGMFQASNTYTNTAELWKRIAAHAILEALIVVHGEWMSLVRDVGRSGVFIMHRVSFDRSSSLA